MFIVVIPSYNSRTKSAVLETSTIQDRQISQIGHNCLHIFCYYGSGLSERGKTGYIIRFMNRNHVDKRLIVRSSYTHILSGSCSVGETTCDILQLVWYWHTAASLLSRKGIHPFQLTKCLQSFSPGFSLVRYPPQMSRQTYI